MNNERQDILLNITQGTLKGYREDGVSTFFNVPFASDCGRFRNAGKPQCWEGVRDAQTPAPVFPQKPGRIVFAMGSHPEEKVQDEAAFAVNIWTPDTEGNYPVLFWIHGGGFTIGGSALPFYNGEEFARKAGVVVVNASYRLGVLGNLYMPEIADVNLSVNDVYQALEWTYENVKQFGGNPEDITIAGQSVGAWYAALIMGNKKLQGKYKKAALFSFCAGTYPHTKEEGTERAKQLMERMGLTDPQDLLKASIPEILEGQGIAVNQPNRLNIAFLSVIDGDTIAEDYLKSPAEVSDPSVPVFCGTVAHEGSLFVPRKEGESEEDHLARIQKYTNEAFCTDTEVFLKNLRDAGHNTYRYMFKLESTMPNIHACHCIDIAFFLQNMRRWNAPFHAGMDAEKVAAITKEYSGAFIDFIKTGAPGNNWNKYDGTEKTMKIFE